MAIRNIVDLPLTKMVDLSVVMEQFTSSNQTGGAPSCIVVGLSHVPVEVESHDLQQEPGEPSPMPVTCPTIRHRVLVL